MTYENKNHFSLIAEVVSNNICKEFLEKYNTPQGKFNFFFVLDMTKAGRTGQIILVIDQ